MVTNKLKPSRSKSDWTPLIYALILALGIFIGNTLSQKSQASITSKDLSDDKELSLIKLEQVYQYLENRYVDQVKFSDLTDEAISNALKALDPHSYYVPSQDVKDFNDRLNGHYYGLGVETTLINDRLFITNVHDDTPAEANGLQSGDEILSVDGVEVNPETDVALLMSKFKSMRHRDIQLQLRSREEEEIQTVRISKSRIEVPSVTASFMLDEQTGYVKIKRFSLDTYAEFMGALEPLIEDQEMSNIVIDLRGNPGGYLKQVVDILAQFYTEEDIVLVSTEGINSKKIEYKSTGKNFYQIDKIAVLIDNVSASGSEVLAGAIQDTDRGIIVGASSFGKGLVQERYELIDGSEIRLTTSRYFTPSGRSIQKIYESSANAESDSTQKYTSTNGRPLETHCGIVPDIMVADTAWTEVMREAFMECWLLESDGEETVQDLVSCLQSKNLKLPDSFIEDKLLLLSRSPQDALSQLKDKDEAILKALEYIRSDELFQTVVRH